MATNPFALMPPALSARGIELSYTGKLDGLNAANLGCSKWSERLLPESLTNL